MDKADFKKIRALFLDFDGVLTDNRVLVDENGVESVFCDRSDGMGTSMLKKAGVDVVVISKEKNPVVSARCKKLGVVCLQGIDGKVSVFRNEVKKRGLAKEEVAFIGNDINDLECISEAGIGIAVKDAFPGVLKAADYVTSKKGGYGAVREVADLILGSLEE